MREIILEIDSAEVEEILDRLLALLPSGVRERHREGSCELRIRGQDAPPAAEIERLLGDRKHTMSEHEIPDDWRERRLGDYRQELIGERLVVRPEWAPRAPEGVIDVALADDLAFGSGAHPTTRRILELMLSAPPLGSFADLGCGTGVIAILAARLGWDPVEAVEVLPRSVASASGNVARNGVRVEVRLGDLITEPPPETDGFVATMPAPVHLAATRFNGFRRARWGVISGFGTSDAAELRSAYAQIGLETEKQEDLSGWTVITLANRG